MPEQADGVGDKPHLDYYVLSYRFDSAWFGDHHEYWPCECDFELPMCTNRRLTKTLVTWINVEVFKLLSHDLLKMYVPPSDW